MLFLEGQILLQCIIEKLQVICKKPQYKSTLYWGEGGGGREMKNAKIWQSVPTILASIVSLQAPFWSPLLSITLSFYQASPD